MASGAAGSTFSANPREPAFFIWSWHKKGHTGRNEDEQGDCCRTFKLDGGTGRMAGATGEGTMIWRPSARELKSQLDGTALLNVSGIVIWRDFKISKSN
jgi:hypothetical protein